MHGEALNAFEKIIAQKKNILKLEKELSHLKIDFECLKEKHAYLVNEKILIPCLESPKQNSPNYDSNWMNFSRCETCPTLHMEIEFLTLKLEQVSKGEIKINMKSKDKRDYFKIPYKKKYSFVNKNEDGKPHTHNVSSHYCGRLGHTTPHYHIMRLEVPKVVMMWVPKNVDIVSKNQRSQLRLRT